MIICYHKVFPVAKTGWWVSVDAFYRQMSSLRSRSVVYLDDYDSTNPDHVVITFDGVYDNVHEYALPIMESLGYPFELFVIGDMIGEENTFDQAVEPPCHFADERMIEDMTRRGGRVQWHTRTHGRFSDIDEAEQRHELSIPDELAARYNAPNLRWFAYPHGAIGDDSRELVRERFVGALACDDGDTRDRYYMPRRLVFEEDHFYKERVSAIVANYNYGRFLCDAIDSLERQSLPPDEILIIDDASTDESSDVLDALAARGYRIERNEKNLGIVENFRKAVALTSGEYIFFLGADNRLRSDFVLECRLALDGDTRAAVAYTDMLLWGARAGQLARSVGASKIGRSQVENWDIYQWRVPDPTPDTLSRFASHNFVHGSSMYRRSFYDAVGGYRASEGPEDHHLFYRMWAAGGGLVHVPLPLLEYRQHSTAQANTVLSLQTENRALRDQAVTLAREAEAVRTNMTRELDAERSLTHSLTGTTRELVSRLAAAEDEAAREAERLRSTLEAERSSRLEELHQRLAALDASGTAQKSEFDRLQQTFDSQRVVQMVEINRLHSMIDAQRAAWDANLNRLSDRFSWTQRTRRVVRAGQRLFASLIVRKQPPTASISASQIADAHGIFDPAWYAEREGLSGDGALAWQDFQVRGFAAGRDPSPLFDGRWYLDTNADVERAGIIPFQHFLESGAQEGRSPHPLFDAAWYRETYADIADAVRNPLLDYLQTGAQEGRNPNALFDGRWYLETNADVGEAGVNPLQHYLEYGGRERRSPHPLFDAAWYLAYYADVAASHMNPLVHFLAFGGPEGRDPHPLFSSRWYRETYAEVADAGANPLRDYLVVGAKQGRNPNPLFDGEWYLATYPDVARAGRNPLVDYVVGGAQAGRDPNSVFKTSWYLHRHPSVAASGQDPLDHALRWAPEDIAPGFDAEFYRVQTGLRHKNSAECLAHYLSLRLTRPLRSIAEVDQTRLNKAMGVGVALEPQTIAIGMVLYNEDPDELAQSLRSIRTALEHCGPSIVGHVFLIDNGEHPSLVATTDGLTYIRNAENLGFGAGHNTLMRLAFEGTARVYIGLNSDGILHREALAALLRMHAAQSEQALIEALQFPEEHPKLYDPEILETPWISCACYLIPRRVYGVIGGFDPNIFLYCEDVDLSWSARRAGFKTMICPAALFFHDVSDRGYEAWRFREMLVSGRYLAHKWGGAEFLAWAEDLLVSRGFARHRDELPPLDDLTPLAEKTSIADFSHGFSFAPVRW